MTRQTCNSGFGHGTHVTKLSSAALETMGDGSRLFHGEATDAVQGERCCQSVQLRPDGPSPPSPPFLRLVRACRHSKPVSFSLSSISSRHFSPVSQPASQQRRSAHWTLHPLAHVSSARLCASGRRCCLPDGGGGCGSV